MLSKFHVLRIESDKYNSENLGLVPLFFIVEPGPPSCSFSLFLAIFSFRQRKREHSARASCSDLVSPMWCRFGSGHMYSQAHALPSELPIQPSGQMFFLLLLIMSLLWFIYRVRKNQNVTLAHAMSGIKFGASYLEVLYSCAALPSGLLTFCLFLLWGVGLFCVFGLKKIT